MSKRYYECHITIEGPPDDVRKRVEAFGWKFSCIDGDPVVGPGVKCYATMHYNERQRVQFCIDMTNMVADVLAHDFPVTRRKVEVVVYDTRSKLVAPDEEAL